MVTGEHSIDDVQETINSLELFDFLINADNFLRFPLPVQYKILPLPYLQGPEKAGIL